MVVEKPKPRAIDSGLQMKAEGNSREMAKVEIEWRRESLAKSLARLQSQQRSQTAGFCFFATFLAHV
jgi:hypothetical protein